ncbi:MAG: AraC family transcriptional regulator [Thermoanaerobaculia bacterium]|nr:AraC family transcriptional regulator [Thermoanaerobaculia bacterium]
MRDASRPAPWLEGVRDLIHDRFREPLSLDDLAMQAGVHPVHLARAFRAAYDASPGEYSRRLRLRWASEQLLKLDRGIADIADEAGFADQSHFTRAFRAVYGLPPGAWRASRSPNSRRSEPARSEAI